MSGFKGDWQTDWEVKLQYKTQNSDEVKSDEVCQPVCGNTIDVLRENKQHDNQRDLLKIS
jgi:hypothetical protein